MKKRRRLNALDWLAIGILGGWALSFIGLFGWMLWREPAARYGTVAIAAILWALWRLGSRCD